MFGPIRKNEEEGTTFIAGTTLAQNKEESRGSDRMTNLDVEFITRDTDSREIL